MIAPTRPPAERCDRGDAVNLAYSTREDESYGRVSPKGVRVLVDAVLAMDEYIRGLKSPPSSTRATDPTDSGGDKC